MIVSNDRQPPEPKVGDSNSPWRAANTGENNSQLPLKSDENTRDGLGLATQGLHSDASETAVRRAVWPLFSCSLDDTRTVKEFLSDLRIELIILTPSLSYSDDSGLVVLQ